jgi:hypothetical protein
MRWRGRHSIADRWIIAGSGGGAPELGVEVVEGAKSPKIEEVRATAGDAVGVSQCGRCRGRGRQVGGGVGIKGKKGVVRKKSSRREKPSGKKAANAH